MARFALPSLSWRLVRRLALAAVVIALALTLLVRVLAVMPVGRAYVEARIEALSIRGQSVEIEGLRGDLLGRLRIERLDISDAEGRWLTAKDVDLKWAPLSALSKHLNIRDIAVEDVSIARRPILQPSKSRRQNGSLFTAYTVEELMARQVSLADGVAGLPSVYRAEATFNHRREKGALNLALSPLAYGQDRIDADVSWGDGAPLLGELALAGEPGGLVASLIGAHTGARVAANLNATYENQVWALDAEAQVGDLNVLSVAIEADGENISLSGTADPRASTYTAGLSQRFGGPAEITGTIDRSSSDMPLEMTLTAPNIVLDASGTYVARGGQQSLQRLTAEVTFADVAAATGLQSLRLSSLNLDGDLTRADTSWQYAGVITSPDIGWDGRVAKQARFDGDLIYADSAVQVDADLAARSVSGIAAAVDPMLSAPVKGTLAGRYNRLDGRLALTRLDVVVKGATLKSRGDISSSGASNLNGSLLIEPQAGLPASGAMQWSLQRSNKQTKGSVSGDAALQTTNADVRTLIGPSTKFETNIAYREDGTLQLSDIRLNGGVLAMTGEAKLDDGQLAAKMTGKTDPVTLAATDLGPGTFTLDLAGPTDNLSADLQADFDWLSRAGQRAEKVNLTAQARRGENISGTASLSSLYRGENLAAKAGFLVDGETWRVSDLEATYSQLILAGDVSGIGGDPNSINSQLSVSGTLLDRRAFTGALSYEAGIMAADLQAEDLQFGLARFDTARLVASGTWPDFQVDVNAAGISELGGLNAALQVSPSIRIDASERTLQADLQAQIGTQAIQTTRPLNVSIKDGLTFDAAIAGFDGELSLAGNLKQTGNANLTLVGLNLSKLGPLIGRPSLRGQAAGSVALFSVDDKIEGSGQFEILNLARGAPDAASADLKLQANLSGEQFELDARALDGDAALDLQADLLVPMQTSYAGRSIQVRPGTVAELNVKGGGAIAPLWSLAARPDLRLEGNLDVDLQARGALDHLRPTGPVKLRDGLFEDGETGLLLKAITVDADLKEDAIEVASASARGSRGGSLSGAGRYVYDGSGNVDLKLDRLDAFKRRDFTAIVSGDVAIGRSSQRTDITGVLRLNEARLDLSHLPRKGYTTLDVRFDDMPETGPSQEVQSPVRLNLEVKANRRLFVSGAGIDSEWSIAATIKGSPSAPRLGGRAQIVRGEADLISRRFTIDEGTIRFDGAPDDTQVNIRAERSDDGITAAISVTGPVMDPDIRLSSDPDLPEDEVISRVLFGQSPSQLSPFQAAQLAAAAAQLAGGSTFDLAAPLQSAIGLDRLDFGVDDNGGATVSTGKYLARDIYLEIETGATGAPGVTVEWTPLRNVEVDANIDPELGPRVAVQWKRDFDAFGEGKAAEPE